MFTTAGNCCSQGKGAYDEAGRGETRGYGECRRATMNRAQVGGRREKKERYTRREGRKTPLGKKAAAFVH